MIDIDAMIDRRFPDLKSEKKTVYKATTAMLKKLVHQDEINRFITSNRHLVGLEFLDAVLDHFDFKFSISNRDRQNIPDQGRLLIVANHPLGSLDGLALIKLVSEIRPDVKIVATTLLNQIDPLSELFLSVDNMSKKASHFKSMKSIVTALQAEQAVIMFPTGEVSRIRPNGVRDEKWKSGFVHLAKKTKAPILPVHIDGKNSALFYSLSTIYKPVGTMMLVNEMFNKHDKEIAFKVGRPIPWDSIASLDLSPKEIAKKMRKQVYALTKKKSKVYFKTMENVVHPANRQFIRNELKQSELIGATQDGKQIFLFDYRSNSSVIREIGRLRELSFRQVEEGTGNRIDIDDYDRYYRHLVLWDDEELEIVGAYRIGEAWKIVRDKGLPGLYSHSLFEYREDMIPYLGRAIELGRSFVQPRYWGKRSLDYLWYGIGAYIQRHPEVKYMFGPVSLSAAYPEEAKQEIVNFYSTLFGQRNEMVIPRQPRVPETDHDFLEFKNVCEESEYKKAYALLNNNLNDMGVRVPTLFKQYVELCHPGGCEFLGFNVDPDFSNCIDAMILVHLDAVKDKKRDRYINSHAQNTEYAA